MVEKTFIKKETKAIYMFYCFFIDYLYVSKSERILFLIFYCVKLNMIIATLKGLMWVKDLFISSLQVLKKDQKFHRKKNPFALSLSNFNIYVI